MLPNTEKGKIIGYWMPDKKVQKLNMHEFKKECKRNGYELVKMDLTTSLDVQGPFCIIFHKCIEIINKAKAGNTKSQNMMIELERYLTAHPEVPIIDPLDKVRYLLDRYRCYLALCSNQQLANIGVFLPKSVELTSHDQKVNIAELKKAGVGFPVVCKPSLSHGSTEAHQMAVIFNEAGVADCKPPAVAQAYVNHNAVLYKVYCIGNQYATVERPSLKNFYPKGHEETIFFTSTDVSKSDSISSLNALDSDDLMNGVAVEPLDPEKLKIIVQTIQNEIGLKFLGIDIVVENNTGRYAIIDLNSYPGYDGFPNLFDSMLVCLEESIKNHRIIEKTGTPDTPSSDQFPTLTRTEQEDSGIDTSDSSDEKKRQLHNLAKVR